MGEAWEDYKDISIIMSRNCEMIPIGTKYVRFTANSTLSIVDQFVLNIQTDTLYVFSHAFGPFTKICEVVVSP